MKPGSLVVCIIAAVLTLALAAFNGMGAIRVDEHGQALLLLGPTASAECASGGGCVILSRRQAELVELLIRANERAKGRRPDAGI